MAYSTGSLRALQSLLINIPDGGSLLDLGAQDIAQVDSRETLIEFVRMVDRDPSNAEQIVADRFPANPPWRLWELFRSSRYRYQCIDLFPGEFIIEADLNTFSVDHNSIGSFEIVINLGTSEHIADQVNTLRVIHDFTKTGGLMKHSVPFTGYFNHGLFNYHPAFFIFVAQANDYEIMEMGLSSPHFPYTIPPTKGIFGSSKWSSKTIESGMIDCLLRKRTDAPFKLFTDFDQATMGRLSLDSPWAEIIAHRYDLRVWPQDE